MTTKIDKKSVEEMGDLGREVRALLGEYAEVKATAEAAVAHVIEELNAKRSRLAEIIREAHQDADSYYDEKSEKWQEGDRGSAYGDWRDELDRIAGEIENEIEAPDFPDLDEPEWLGEVEGEEFVEFSF